MSEPARPPALSMQTTYARQQQQITLVLVLLLLGPLTLALAGLLAALVGRDQRRLLWCALVGLLALGVGGLWWPTYQQHLLDLGQLGVAGQQLLQAGPAGGRANASNSALPSRLSAV